MAIRIPSGVAASAFCDLFETNRGVRTTAGDLQYILSVEPSKEMEEPGVTFVIQPSTGGRPKRLKLDVPNTLAVAELVAKTVIYDTEKTEEIKNCFTLMQMKKGVPPKTEGGEVDWSKHTETMAEIWCGLKDGKPWIAFGLMGWPLLRFELKPLE